MVRNGEKESEGMNQRRERERREKRKRSDVSLEERIIKNDAQKETIHLSFKLSSSPLIIIFVAVK